MLRVLMRRACLFGGCVDLIHQALKKPSIHPHCLASPHSPLTCLQTPAKEATKKATPSKKAQVCVVLLLLVCLFCCSCLFQKNRSFSFALLLLPAVRVSSFRFSLTLFCHTCHRRRKRRVRKKKRAKRRKRSPRPRRRRR